MAPDVREGTRLSAYTYDGQSRTAGGATTTFLWDPPPARAGCSRKAPTASSITPVAGARELSTESGSKPASAIATRTYGSVASDVAIAAHYREVLGRVGWSLARQRETTSGQESCFVRGDETAALVVGGMDHPDWRYSLSIGWQSFDCN